MWSSYTVEFIVGFASDISEDLFYLRIEKSGKYSHAIIVPRVKIYPILK